MFFVRSAAISATNASSDGEFVVGTIGPGELIGEITVVTGGRRTATLRSVGVSDVFVIERSAFEAWLADHGDIADAVSRTACERIDRTHVAKMTARIIGTGAPATRAEHPRPGRVAPVGGRRPARRSRRPLGRRVLRHRPGRVLVSAPTDDGDEPVAELGRGEFVGKQCVLETGSRSATVRAVRNTTLAMFWTESLEQVIASTPGVALHVGRDMISRARAARHGAFGRASDLDHIQAEAVIGMLRDLSGCRECLTSAIVRSRVTAYGGRILMRVR